MMLTCRTPNRLWSLTGALALTALMTAAPVTAASNEGADVVNHVPITFLLTSCSGEPVAIVGDMRVLSHIHDDGNGAFHARFSGGQDGSGVGQVSGDVYQFSSVFGFSVNGLGSPSVQSFEMKSHLNTAGPNNNTYLHTTFHITINANGDVTVVNVDTRADCQ
jgi:hypothetical protein